MTFQEGDHESSLWNEQDGMYYDAIVFGPGQSIQLPVRSLVGLIPLYGTLVLEPAVLNKFPGFKKRMQWFIDNRPEVSARNMANMKGELFLTIVTCLFLLTIFFSLAGGKEQRRLLALASKERLVRILEKMLDENEFLSEHGIRSLVFLLASADLWLLISPGFRMSKLHQEFPWGMDVHGQRYEVGYWPGDSRSDMFGGNSNWRGPICKFYKDCWDCRWVERSPRFNYSSLT